jgi:hypothetical protein
MAERYFTPEEANEALAAVRPLAEQLVAHRRALLDAQERQAELSRTVAGNGEALDARDVIDVQARIARESAELASCIARIQDLGVLVKDLDRGLVDFPAQHEGEEVLLCWQVGEPEIGYWHGVDEGYAGRKPLPL